MSIMSVRLRVALTCGVSAFLLASAIKGLGGGDSRIFFSGLLAIILSRVLLHLSGAVKGKHLAFATILLSFFLLFVGIVAVWGSAFAIIPKDQFGCLVKDDGATPVGPGARFKSPFSRVVRVSQGANDGEYVPVFVAHAADGVCIEALVPVSWRAEEKGLGEVVSAFPEGFGNAEIGEAMEEVFRSVVVGFEESELSASRPQIEAAILEKVEPELAKIHVKIVHFGIAYFVPE